MLIPARAVGNAHEIKVVDERWYSEELGALVKSSTSDPRFGVSSYELTNIVQTDPDESLFQIPVDYVLKANRSSFGFTQGITLSPPGVQKQLATGLDQATWGDAPKWSGRYLVAFRSGQRDAPEFALYDDNDQVVVRRAVTVGDAKSISISDVVADESGNSYVAAAALSNSGAIVRFIQKFDVKGQNLGMIRTNPFQAVEICSTGDGTLWALGWDEVADGRNGKHAGYPILRHFDFARGQIGATLQRELVPWDFDAGPRHAVFACNSKSVGLYLAADGLWFEMDAGGHSLSLRRLPPIGMPPGWVTGSALTAAGSFFVTTYNPSSRHPTSLFQLQGTDATHASLLAINAPPIHLLGSDGENLVYVHYPRADPSADPDPTVVYWAAAP